MIDLHPMTDTCHAVMATEEATVARPALDTNGPHCEVSKHKICDSRGQFGTVLVQYTSGVIHISRTEGRACVCVCVDHKSKEYRDSRIPLLACRQMKNG